MENLQDVFDQGCGWPQLTYVMPITPFHLPKITKNTSPFLGRIYTTASWKKEPVIFHAYPHDEHLCPVTLIKQYRLIRDAFVPPTEKAFFVTHGKPHHAATKDTLARWVKIPCF